MAATVHKSIKSYHALLFASAMAEHRAAIAMRAKGQDAEAAVAEAAASAYAYALKKHQETFAALTGDGSGREASEEPGTSSLPQRDAA